jgi:hypothetical protein
MQKIPTLFLRDFEHSNGRYVTTEVTPGCEWVLAGEGVPTRKYDGTCVMFDGQEWWARREVKPGKDAPPNFVEIEHDETTGKTVGWEPYTQSGFARWIDEVVARHSGWDKGTYELCGPKVNGNPEGFRVHALIPHSEAMVFVGMTPTGFNAPTPPTFETLRDFMQSDWFTIQDAEYPEVVRRFEGIVWHHPDGRMAKLKVKDFPKAET